MKPIKLTQKQILPPCPRCGSKQRVAKVWKEKIKTFTGTTEVEFTQIVCTNDACQKAFDKGLKEEAKKKKEADKEKARKDAERKEASIKHAKTTKALKKGKQPASKQKKSSKPTKKKKK